MIGFFRNFDNQQLVKRRFILLVVVLFICELAYLQFAGCSMEEGETAQEALLARLSAAGKTADDIATGFRLGFIVRVKEECRDEAFADFASRGIDRMTTFESIPAFRTRLSQEQLLALVEDDRVARISPDRVIQSALTPSHMPKTTGATVVEFPTYLFGNLNWWGKTGQGVTIAIVDSGIYAHPDFGNRILSRVDFVNDGTTGDPYGHGTHVAGLAAGSGYESIHDGYTKYISGVAPKAGLVDLRVLNAQGEGQVSSVISAIDWVIANRNVYNIRVMNFSLGLNPNESHGDCPMSLALANAVLKYDLIAVACAGNYGEYNGNPVWGGIVAPGNNPYAITVGGAETNQTDIRSDDATAVFTSRGPTVFDGLVKPDLVAPALFLKSAYSPDNNIAYRNPWVVIDPCDEGASNCTDEQYMMLSGTSMSSPIVAGTVALMLQANPSLTPNAVKAILHVTAQDLGEPTLVQGAGLLNLEGAVRLANNVEDLEDLEFNDPWLTNSVNPYSTIAGEQVVWAQGITWTDIILGIGTWTRFQAAYGPDVVWGQGITWTDIVMGMDPVWDLVAYSEWSTAMLNPMTTPAANGDDVVRGYFVWETAPTFLSVGDPGFPEE